MGKLIIDNRSSVDDTAALQAVELVMREGRTSDNGKQYCYLTAATCGGRKVMISTDRNKRSDRFVVVNDKRLNP